LLSSTSSQRKTSLSSANNCTILTLSDFWLFPTENGPQWDKCCKHGGHQLECDDCTPEDSKRSLLPVLPTMAGSMEQMCVCVCVCVCARTHSPTLKVTG
jgi:hypothetical protein